MNGTGLGALEIQMVMDLLPFKRQMDEAQATVGRAASGIGDTIKAAMAGLVAGLSLGAFVAMVKGAVDAAEALHDLAIQTGASVESLSAMIAVGKTTGTSAETIGQAMNRLAKTLAVANESSKGAGQAVKALGLNFDDLRRMKPDQQMVTLAAALNKVEDGSGKSAVAMTLLGKEGAKLLPFMKDLANTGALVATVTTEQAAAADEYNDAVTVSHMRLEALQRSVSFALLPAMMQMHDLTGDLARQMGGYLAGGTASVSERFDAMGGVIRILGSAMEALIVLASNVAFVFGGIGNTIGGLAAQAVQLLQGNFAAVGAINDEIKARNASAREELDKFEASVLGTTDRILQNRDALNSHGLSAADNNAEMARLSRRYGTTKKAVLDFTAAGDEATKKAADNTAKLIEAGQNYLAQVDQRLASARAELEAGRALSDSDKDLIKLEQQLREGKMLLTQSEVDAARTKLIEIEALGAAFRLKQDLAKLEFEEQQRRLKDTGDIAEQTAKQLEHNASIGKTADELDRLEIARIAQQTAIAEQALQTALLNGVSAQELEGYTLMVEELRKLKAAKEQGVLLEAGEEAAKSARKAAEEWQKTVKSIGDGLTDALLRAFESGKGFAAAFRDTLVNAFKNLVLRPLIEFAVSPITGAITAALGGSGSAIAGNAPGGSLGGVLGQASGLSSLTGLVDKLGQWGSGVGTAIYSLFTTGSSVGTTATNAALIDSAAGTAGYGASSASIAGSMGQLLGYGAGAIGGYALGSLISGNRSAIGNNPNTATLAGTAIGTLIGGPLGGLVGGGIGGLVNRAFGKGRTELQDRYIEGQIYQGGLFGAQNISAYHRDGGWFSSSDNWHENADLDTSVLGAINSQLQGVYQNAIGVAKALNLGTYPLGQVQQLFSVHTLNRSDADITADIARIVGEYKAKLGSTFDAAVASVRQAGETTLQTMDRLSGSLLVVNQAFGNLGLNLLDASVAGGKAASNIVQLTGGIDSFISKTDAYLKNYLSEGEQAGLVARNIQQQLASDGLGGRLDNFKTKGDLRWLLEQANPADDAGQKQIAALLNVAGDFASISAYMEKSGLTLAQVAALAPTSAVALAAATGSATGSGAAADATATLLTTANDHLAKVADSTFTTVDVLKSVDRWLSKIFGRVSGADGGTGTTTTRTALIDDLAP